ncbi:MAG TPA: NHL repeat-containing protein, partial [bacterium]|nr:NHL repeat-containing protein [bacterium]
SPPTFGAPTTFSSPGAVPLNQPYNLRLDHSGNVWVTDYGNARLVEFGQSGSYIKKIAPTISNFKPTDLAFDASGNIFVTDEVNSQIVEMSSSGSVATEVGDAVLNHPEGIVSDGNGNYYVADMNHHQIVVFH